MKSQLILGLDESGTGSWASAFTVTGFLVDASQEAVLAATKVRDSKKLSDARRRALCEETAAHCLCAETILVEPNYTDQRMAWREAMAKAAKRCFEALDYDIKKCKIIIDGDKDQILYEYFLRVWFIDVIFEPKADDKYAAVSAASVWAKTVRNDRLLEDHKQYPMYGWNKNYGYGTEDHMEAICVHGISPLHRRIAPLAHYFNEKDVPKCPSSRSVPGALMSSFTSSMRKTGAKPTPSFRRNSG